MNETDETRTPRAPGGRKYLAGFLVASLALIALAWFGWAVTGREAVADHVVTVYKTPTCGCCGDWVAHLRDAGLDVEVVDVASTQAHRAEAGVPNRLGSCHTAVVGDYFVEGHVPADLVAGLIEKKPAELRGIAVPGMPVGSPGMEGPNPVEYDVLAVDRDGQVFVFATRQGSSERRAD
ncbi:MAG: DUF411 domain-containing protein [Woeseiaceae bacterium]|nr:DUF411 domain-containing protein [Woeseiaceae bacterium]